MKATELLSFASDCQKNPVTMVGRVPLSKTQAVILPPVIEDHTLSGMILLGLHEKDDATSRTLMKGN
jgi:hypothetical protein